MNHCFIYIDIKPSLKTWTLKSKKYVICSDSPVNNVTNLYEIIKKNVEIVARAFEESKKREGSNFMNDQT